MAYSVEEKNKIFDEICFRVSEGESLSQICRSFDNKPDRPTIYDWIRADKEFHNRYARAMELRAILLVDEILTISDDNSNDTLTIQKGNEEIDIENKEWVNRSRLRVDSRKWIASKFYPKAFGDKIELEHSGEIKTTQPVFNFKNLNSEQQ